MGLPGPDAGKGGKHLLVGPDYTGALPANGYFVHLATSNRQIVGARSLLVGGGAAGAMQRLRTIKVYPRNPDSAWKEPEWIDLTDKLQDTTPLAVETTLEFWTVLHETVDYEPTFAGYHTRYGELAELGIEKGKPFAPDDRMTLILETAARLGTHKCAYSPSPTAGPADTSGRIANWNTRHCDSKTATSTPHVHLAAREKWFYQAVGASPAMFRRDTNAGSLYWLGHRDAAGCPLDGANTYTLCVHSARSASSARQAVLVGHPLRHRHPLTDPDQPEQGSSALTVRTQRPHRRIRRPVLRAQCTDRPGEHLDSDDPRQGLVRLLPDLPSAGRRIRRTLATRRFRGGVSAMNRLHTGTRYIWSGFWLLLLGFLMSVGMVSALRRRSPASDRSSHLSSGTNHACTPLIRPTT